MSEQFNRISTEDYFWLNVFPVDEQKNHYEEFDHNILDPVSMDAKQDIVDFIEAISLDNSKIIGPINHSIIKRVRRKKATTKG
jgi:hypothetical protein